MVLDVALLVNFHCLISAFRFEIRMVTVDLLAFANRAIAESATAFVRHTHLSLPRDDGHRSHEKQDSVCEEDCERVGESFSSSERGFVFLRRQFGAHLGVNEGVIHAALLAQPHDRLLIHPTVPVLVGSVMRKRTEHQEPREFVIAERGQLAKHRRILEA
jgi:hypothetical protein